jgi:predicted amidophosphoribosyltransferase
MPQQDTLASSSSPPKKRVKGPDICANCENARLPWGVYCEPCNTASKKAAAQKKKKKKKNEASKASKARAKAAKAALAALALAQPQAER